MDFVLLVLKLYPIQVVFSLPLWMKLTSSQLFLFFLSNFFSFVSYIGGALGTNLFFTVINWYVYFWYSVNYNTCQAFLTHFLICSDLLNCLRSVGIIVITTESGLNRIKVIFTKPFLRKPHFFAVFLYTLCCTAAPDISSSTENINSMAHISRLYFCFLWPCYKISIQIYQSVYLFLNILIPLWV